MGPPFSSLPGGDAIVQQMSYGIRGALHVCL
jgi:hypothetical protein